MNGVHDMGGMHGFGPVRPEANEPIFHHRWEARMLALTLAMGAWGKWNLDVSRFARERTPPADYLRYSYYERWYAGLVRLMQETGLVSAAELASGRPAPGSARATPPVRAAAVPAILDRGGPTERAEGRPARFRVGQRVRARNINPEGHTRLPRYARGKAGVIVRDHGIHVFADSNALRKGEDPQHLYAVRFDAADLWGADARFRGGVHIDLWDSHLDAA